MPGFAPVPSGQGRDSSPRARASMTLGALLSRIALAAGPYATRYSTYPASDLTPEAIVSARREAHNGYPMRWAEMVEEVSERNTHWKAVAHKRRAWIFGVPCRVDPPEQFRDDRPAQMLAAWLTAVVAGINRAAWVHTLYNLLSASAYGYAAAEVFWTYKTLSFTGPGGGLVRTPGVLVPVSTAPVHQKHWRFDLASDDPLLWAGEGRQGISWAWGKFIVNRHLDDGVIGRRGWGTAGIWMDLAIQNGWAALIVFMAKYGLPQLGVFIEKAIETQGLEREKVDLLINDYGEGKIAVLDDEMDMRQVAKVEGDIIHQDVIKLGQLELSKLVLGSTLVMDQGTGTGSYNMSDTHAESSADYTRAPDSTALAAAIDTDMLAAAVEYNIDQLVEGFRAAGVVTDASSLRERVGCSSWRTIEREPSGAARLALLEGAQRLVGPQGYLVDPGQVSRELAITLVRAPGAVPGAAPSAAVSGQPLSAARTSGPQAGGAAPEPVPTSSATQPSGDAVSAERT